MSDAMTSPKGSATIPEVETTPTLDEMLEEPCTPSKHGDATYEAASPTCILAKDQSFFFLEASELFTVKVAPPALPTGDEPISFVITVHDALRGTSWLIDKRYSAFDGLKNLLWWQRVAMSAHPLLPPKHPQPGRDAKKLEERAAGLEAWANEVLRGCHGDGRVPSSVASFFQLPRSGKTVAEDLSQAQDAVVRLQRAARESPRLSRKSSSTAAQLAAASARRGACARVLVMIMIAFVLLGPLAPAFVAAHTAPVKMAVQVATMPYVESVRKAAAYCLAPDEATEGIPAKSAADSKAKKAKKLQGATAK